MSLKYMQIETTSTCNLSTLDEAEYRQTRGTQDLRRVIPNIDYLIAQAPVRDKLVEITIVVIGRLDGQHAENLREIDRKYADAGVVNVLIRNWASRTPASVAATSGWSLIILSVRK